MVVEQVVRRSTATHDVNAASQENFQPQIDKELVAKAVNALLKYHEKQVETQDKSQLFGEDSVVQVQFTLEVAPVRNNPKPLRLVIPYEIYKVTDESVGDNLEEPDVCLIVKDEAKPWLQEMIEKFPQHMGHIKKVLTLDSLRTKHKEFKQRRALMQRYSVFMADDRIVPMLMKALGKKFWEAKKQPIPIRITRKDSLPHMIRSALRSVYITLSAGTCVTAKGGYTGMPVHKLVENCIAISNQAAKKIPRGWANIRSIGIKTSQSTLLPVYNRTPEQLEEMARMAGLPLVYVDDDENQDQNHKDEDSERKRVLDTKSPLVKALKKQRRLDNNSKLMHASSADVNQEQERTGRDRESTKHDPEKEKKSLADKSVSRDSTSEANEETKPGNKEVDVDDLSDSGPPKSKRKTSIPSEAGGRKDSRKKNKRGEATGVDGETEHSTVKEKPEDVNKRKKENTCKDGDNAGKESKFETMVDQSKERVQNDGKTKRKVVEAASAETSKNRRERTKKTKRDGKPPDDQEGNTKEFISSKSFSGSKKGYVFKRGDKGIGYYADVESVVDNAKLDAIMRAAEQKRARGAGEKRRSSSVSSKGKRRGRR